MMIPPFVNVIKKSFKSLADEFELQVVNEHEHDYEAEVVFTNTTTGIRVTLDWAEFRPFLRLFKLVDEQHDATEPTREFDVDDLLIIRMAPPSPVGKVLHGKEHTQAADLLSTYARALAHHARDVLEGDFTVLSMVETVVASRSAKSGERSASRGRQRDLPG